MKKTLLTVVLLFSVQSYASFIDRAAYLLSQTGTLKSKITKSDCTVLSVGIGWIVSLGIVKPWCLIIPRCVNPGIVARSPH